MSLWPILIVVVGCAASAVVALWEIHHHALDTYRLMREGDE